MLLKNNFFIYSMIFIFSNCVSISNYFQNRGNDFLDIVSLQINQGSTGAEITAGPVLFGLHRGEEVYGINLKNAEFCISRPYSEFESRIKADMSRRGENYNYYKCNWHSSSILVFYQEKYSPSGGDSIFPNHNSYRNDKKKYEEATFDNFGDNKSISRYGRIGGKAGASIIGVAIEFNVLEVFDFVLGIVGIDILDDDHTLKD
ncbi:MAG TPA: hypothetical protein PKN56_02840 [Leptospiraceae bacterium]|nr:hypothetical protein [Leptospiraceae bacterium]HNF23557.1 hypothetical protein [Leptospiraceae bacterium]HNN02472.1 hypothetical protein [Leptospiraceae bacterium]